MKSDLPPESLDRFRPKETSDLTEVGLLHKAAPFAKAFEGRLPTASELRNITEEMGVELATAVFARVIQESKVHGSFVRQVRGFDLTFWPLLKPLASACEVTVVASQLPQIRRSGRQWGDHVEKWRAWARSLGFTTDSIDTDPRDSIANNARRISDYFTAHPHPHRILVTYGQGASELRFLFQHRGDLHGIRAWINVCGSFGGSSSSRWLTRTPWRRFGSKVDLRLAGRHPMALTETSSHFAMWKLPPRLPANVLVTNLIGLPYRSHLPQGLNRSYHELAKISPNDGVVTVSEAIAQPGFVVPIPGMSHKADDLHLEPVFKRLLGVILEAMRKEAEAKSTGFDRSNELVLDVR